MPIKPHTPDRRLGRIRTAAGPEAGQAVAEFLLATALIALVAVVALKAFKVPVAKYVGRIAREMAGPR